MTLRENSGERTGRMKKADAKQMVAAAHDSPEKPKLRVLLIEDDLTDAMLVGDELRHDFTPIIQRVETEPAFRDAITQHSWDVILSDFRLPTFSATEALRIFSALNHDTPFLIVSGTIGEEVAVELLRAGAQDFVLKDNLPRLRPAILREVRNAARRREAEKELHAGRVELRKLQQTGRQLLREVRRLDLNFREYQIAELLLELSYGWGLPSIVIPELKILCALLGVHKSHVCTYLANLIEIGIVVVEKTERGPRYTVTRAPAQWRCRLKISRETVAEAITALKVFNNLADSKLAAEFKADSLGAPHFFEPPHGAKILAAVTKSATVTNFGELFDGRNGR